MASPTTGPSPIVRRGRRLWLWALGLGPIAGVAAASWWFTAPLRDSSPPTPTLPTVAPAPSAAVDPGWPEGVEEGEPAKRRLLAVLLRDRALLSLHVGYTATLRKQERMNGKLGPEQTIAMKVRNRPFGIYLKFLSPKLGKEVVYAEGHHDGKVIAHNGDWTRMLIPRLAVNPTDRLALADTRHPVTEAGLFALVEKLIGFRELDLDQSAAVTILDRATIDGKAWLRSLHLHSDSHAGRPFARVEVLYDPESRLPAQIRNYSFPEPGQTGEPLLAERYAYLDLKWADDLTDLDFDPSNPAYAFMR